MVKSVLKTISRALSLSAVQGGRRDPRTLRGPLVLLILLSLTGQSLSAETLRAAIDRHTESFAAQSVSPARNPYKTPALGLLAGGGALLILGIAQDRGVEVGTNASGTAVSAKETGGSKTALTTIGALAVASGAGLYFWGEQKKNRPQVSLTPRGVSAKVAVRF